MNTINPSPEEYSMRKNLLKTKIQYLKRSLDKHSKKVGRELVTALAGTIDDFKGISDTVRPYRVCVTGEVSVGKSSLLNKLIGGANVLDTDTGSTTKLPMEIVRLDPTKRKNSNKYYVTVFYITVDEVKKDLQEIVRCMTQNMNDDDDDVNPPHVEALKARLSNIFGNLNDLSIQEIEGVIDELEPSIAQEGDNLVSLIGRNEKEFEFFSALETNLFIRACSNSAQLPVIRMLRLEGSFANIPPGVILYDTPGLNDPNRINSDRSLTLRNYVDEHWHLVCASKTLSGAEIAVTRELFASEKPLRVIATKWQADLIDRAENDEMDVAIMLDNHKAKLTNQLRANMTLSFTGGRLVKAMNRAAQAEWNDRLPLVQARVDGVPIAFTEFSRNVIGSTGLDTLKEWLNVKQEEKAVAVNHAEGFLEQSIQRLWSLILGKVEIIPPFTEGELSSWWNSVQRRLQRVKDAMAALPQGLLTLDVYHRIIDAGHWDGNQNTIKAAMRRYGNHVACNGTAYNMTSDIQTQYQRQIAPVHKAIDRLRSRVMELDRRDQRVAMTRMNLTHTFDQLHDQTYGNTFKLRLQGLLLPYYRNYHQWWSQRANKYVNYFQQHELLNVFTILQYDWTNGWIPMLENALIQQYDRLVKVVHRDLMTIEQRDEFEILLHGVDAITEDSVVHNQVRPEDRDEFCCPISLAPFIDPVSLICGHIFERVEIVEFARITPARDVCCPLCRGAEGRENMRRLTSRPDILVHMQMYPRHVEPLPEWWKGLWASIVRKHSAAVKEPIGEDQVVQDIEQGN